MPPASFFSNPSGVISSRCSLPLWVTAENPAPSSTPLTALILIRPRARSASSLSNTGSPRPGGTFEAITLIFAPIESPCSRKSSMNFSSSPIRAGSAQKNGLLSTKSKSRASSSIGPSCDTKPRISTPNRSRRYFLAIAPDATRIVVSLADARPPPR